MTDFSSYHFQKARANTKLLKMIVQTVLSGGRVSMLSMRILLCMAGAAALAVVHSLNIKLD
jgi:hypothetical protein